MEHQNLPIADVMTSEPVAVSERITVARALRTLEEVEIRHLPVVDREGLLLGIVSQRDLLAAARAGETRRTLASLMKREVVAVVPETPAHEAAYLLLHHRIGCVPVVDRAGRLIGIATDADFVRVAYVALGGRVPVDQLELEEKEAASV
jgi:CBS domain-containing protein